MEGGSSQRVLIELGLILIGIVFIWIYLFLLL